MSAFPIEIYSCIAANADMQTANAIADAMIRPEDRSYLKSLRLESNMKVLFKNAGLDPDRTMQKMRETRMFIAGSAALWCYTMPETWKPGDVDFFCNDDEDAPRRFADLIDGPVRRIKNNAYTVSSMHVYNCVSSSKKAQLITVAPDRVTENRVGVAIPTESDVGMWTYTLTRTTETEIQHCLKPFDFDCCRIAIAFDHALPKFVFGDGMIESIRTMRMSAAKCTRITRLKKYKSRGFAIRDVDVMCENTLESSGRARCAVRHVIEQLRNNSNYRRTIHVGDVDGFNTPRRFVKCFARLVEFISDPEYTSDSIMIRPYDGPVMMNIEDVVYGLGC